jgi:hypothetical protein
LGARLIDRAGTEPVAVATGFSQGDLPACYRKRFRTIPQKESLTSDEALGKERLERCAFILHFISLINRGFLTVEAFKQS